MSFDTVLVANRGEIAVRIIRTASRMGLRTVAVYSDADAGAMHMRMADEAVRIGPGPAAESYLRVDAIVEACRRTGAGAVHPGYGFLSERADFARACEAAGIAFVGPTPGQIELFGTKNTARGAAARAGVPLMPGTELLVDVEDAVTQANRIGYPVMLKAVAGGGGIGMRACADEAALRAGYDQVTRAAQAGFGNAAVFLERFVANARHVEVQVFGDGDGRVVSLGDRDCSLQRRHQKVIEEAPAPLLPDEVRDRIHAASRTLCARVGYRSAGTVEYVYDPERQEAWFLEVNTRLQVEHPVTEAVTGVDLVEWMLRLARGDAGLLDGVPDGGPPPRGHSVEARVYAEDPARGHQPSSGVVTRVAYGPGARVDGWLEPGREVGTFYDPMLAKVITHADTREAAFAALSDALEHTEVAGIETNLGQLRAAVADPVVSAGWMTTATLGSVRDPRPRIEVVRAGTLTTVQDLPGRLGGWDVGIPPSGPMDDRSFRDGNRILGNPDGAPGLECTLDGPRLRFTHAATVCVTGAPAAVKVNGFAVARREAVRVPAGGELDVGTATGPGMRVYVLVAGGFDVPAYLGSASTFTAGEFGGHAGRALRVGDVLRAVPGVSADQDAERPRASVREPTPAPEFTDRWVVGVSEGPQPAPEYLTRADMAQLYATWWTVTSQAARTGVRLSGPKPTWTRADGGEAGLHPSNLHDNPYSVGALNLTGDTPVLLGPDGPSLGGFVCPVTVVPGERWKIGQLRPGDRIRFTPVAEDTADALRSGTMAAPPLLGRAPERDDGVLGRIAATDATPEVVYRRGAADNILVEYGPMVLDLGLRMRVHALASGLAARGLDGLVDVTPGVRSLHLHTDPDRLPQRRLMRILAEVESELPATADLSVESRTVRLPMSWDDPVVGRAIARYRETVRDDAPWNPSNIEFIRRINGLPDADDVRRIVFDADYLVLGLGDVYLGAPAATPLDPRHRLVTTKYNPARTWTAEGTVGIGGTYMCVYGMNSPGGYQLVGRTIPIWSTHANTGGFEPGVPWLLRFFDRVSWYPVEPDELLGIRADLLTGRAGLDITAGTFTLADHNRFLAENADDIKEFRRRQAHAFEAERVAWEAAGEFAPRPEPEPAPAARLVVPPGGEVVRAPLAATVWEVTAAPGGFVRGGDVLVRLEAMKMEVVVTAPADGFVHQVLVEPGRQIDPGAPLAVLAVEAAA
ncbi:urea carboxylase [Yinghuangia sp. ASG 101]|uniref:urea carboxylase n=1 Tax=Yinghuangia sp. ASG 101 TaxID=2896848 RepID=UPI001E44C9C4|nr:urea carboxylase [Yinghuangia sp. ASG 101]UGQ13478.1 urea carboxylase [Yinghuangia sp. ASG 101]